MSNSEFLKKLSKILMDNIPEEMRQGAIDNLKKQMDDPVMQLAAVIGQTSRLKMNPGDFPIMCLMAAWEVNTILRTCPIPEMRIMLRDYFIDAVMKGDSNTTIFPLVDK
jgi:hypothetical protein